MIAIVISGCDGADGYAELPIHFSFAAYFWTIRTKCKTGNYQLEILTLEGFEPETMGILKKSKPKVATSAYKYRIFQTQEMTDCCSL